MECCFDRGTKCAILTCMKCAGCSFKKTQAQLAHGRKKAIERIASLPYEQRKHIESKYHGGVTTNQDEV